MTYLFADNDSHINFNIAIYLIISIDKLSNYSKKYQDYVIENNITLTY